MKTDVAQQTSLYHPTMITLLGWLEDAAGFEFTQTSTYRDGDGGVHGTILLRAVDLRCLIPSVGVLLESVINTNWVYDPSRPDMRVAIYHDVGQGRHLHLQVHENTERNK